jgi:hypothetical protein
MHRREEGPARRREKARGICRAAASKRKSATRSKTLWQSDLCFGDLVAGASRSIRLFAFGRGREGNDEFSADILWSSPAQARHAYVFVDLTGGENIAENPYLQSIR